MLQHLLFLASICAATALIGSGRVDTPPMGWRHWSFYGYAINQDIIQRSADGLVNKTYLTRNGVPTSLCDLGYCDIGLDDQYQTCQVPYTEDIALGLHGEGYGLGTSPSNPYRFHNPDGSIIIDTTGFFQNVSAGCAYKCGGFPSLSGMTAYIHSLGLAAGWYLNNCICQEKDADTFYEQEVAQMLQLGFDNLKVDNCAGARNMTHWYNLLAASPLAGSFILEACNTDNPRTHGCIGYDCPFNFYRTSNDIEWSWASIMANRAGVLSYSVGNFSQRGSWAYGDMLVVGNQNNPGPPANGFGPAEWRSQFSMWCILSSPLILGTNIADNSTGTLAQQMAIVGNTEAIAINQKYFGYSGGAFTPSNAVLGVTYLYKPQSWDNSLTAVSVTNDGNTPVSTTLALSDIPALSGGAFARDLWVHTTTPVSGGISVTLQAHETALYVVSSQQIVEQVYSPLGASPSNASPPSAVSPAPVVAPPPVIVLPPPVAPPPVAGTPPVVAPPPLVSSPPLVALPPTNSTPATSLSTTSNSTSSKNTIVLALSVIGGFIALLAILLACRRSHHHHRKRIKMPR